MKTPRQIELMMIDLGLPAYMLNGVVNYLCYGILSESGFLRAIFENDLCSAVLMADSQNAKHIKDWVMFLRELPSETFGSPSKVKAYCTHLKTKESQS